MSQPQDARHLDGWEEMMQRSEAEALVKKFFTARVSGEIEPIMALVTDDMRFHLVGSAEHSDVVMQSDGAAAFRETLALFVDNFAFTNFQTLKMLVDGDDIAHHWRVEVRNPKNGKALVTELMDFWVVKGGKIATINEICDTAMAQWMLSN
jgi:ketosteroid isomerase-like protein